MGIDLDYHMQAYNVEFRRKFRLQRKGFKKMKALFGQAPNLPWWRLRSMTDAEIAAYNRSFMQEVKMSEFEIKPDVIKAALKAAENNIWNAAIEAALITNAKLGGSTEVDVAIRKLKK